MTSPSTRMRSSLPATASGTNVHAYTLGDWGLLAAIALIWGSSFLFMEIGLRSFAPGVITMARIALGAGTLALFARARAPVDREDWGRIAFLGVIWMAIPLILFPIAQQWITSSVTGMVNGAMPIFTVAWATYLLRKLPGSRQLMGIGLGFVGIVFIFVPELEAGSTSCRVRCWPCWLSPSMGWPPTSACRSRKSTAPCRSSSGPSWWPSWSWRRSACCSFRLRPGRGSRPWPCCRWASWARAWPSP